MVHAYVWRKLARDEAWGKQGCRCAYCRSPLKRFAATFDHVVPKAAGGTDLNNGAAACRLCNKTKGAMPVKKFRKLLSGNARVSPEVTTCRALLRINRRADLAVKRILAGVA